jgi:hypothetical protein
MGWGAARRWCRPFIGVVGRFGGGDISGGEVAGGGGAWGWPESRSPGDGTARAEAAAVVGWQPLGLFRHAVLGGTGVVGRRGRVSAGWPATMTLWCDGSGRRSNGDPTGCGHVAGSGWRAEEERGTAWSGSQARGPEE